MLCYITIIYLFHICENMIWCHHHGMTHLHKTRRDLDDSPWYSYVFFFEAESESEIKTIWFVSNLLAMPTKSLKRCNVMDISIGTGKEYK